MKKLLILTFFFAVALVVSNLGNLSDLSNLKNKAASEQPQEILRVALVADSHNENELLAKALWQAKAEGVNFVIGLGDYTNLGKINELTDAKKVFDDSGLTYYVIPGDRDGWESRQVGSPNTALFGQVFHPECPSVLDTESRNWIPHQVRDDNGNGYCSVSMGFNKNRIQFVILDNSDLYKGIDDISYSQFANSLEQESELTFVFAHKTPFHPDSAHVMGEESPEVAKQAKDLLELMESAHVCHSVLDTESRNWIPHQVRDDNGNVRDDKCSAVDGFFSGDIHFFARFTSPAGSVKITTIGAVASNRNFQGPRFGILKVYDDYSWEVEDVEIK